MKTKIPNLDSLFETYPSIYREMEPKLRRQLFFKALYVATEKLFSLIEDSGVRGITWKIPYALINFDQEMDWETISPIYPPESKDTESDTHTAELNTLFRILTKDAIFLFDPDESAPPGGYKIRFGSMGEIDRFPDQPPSSFVFNVDFETQTTNKQRENIRLSGTLKYNLFPLGVYTKEEKAHYSLSIELKFEDSKVPPDLYAKERKAFYGDILKAIKERAATEDVITSDIELAYAEPQLHPLVKYSKPFLDAKFVSKEVIEEQLKLFDLESRNNVEISIKGGIEGIDLTVYQERTLDGILAKFDQYDYKPDTLELTKSELYELTGIEKVRTSRGKLEYPGYETKKIERGLKDLASTNYPIILKQRSGYHKRKKEATYTVARAYAPLINVVWWHKDVTENKLVEYEKDPSETNKKLSPYFSHWDIRINPLLKQDIEDRYRLLPLNLHSQIRDYKKQLTKKGSPRVANTEIFFIKWLHKHGKSKGTKDDPIKIDHINLAKQLKLSSLVEKREWTKLRKKITELYKLGKGLGYITDYQVGVKSIFKKDKTIDHIYLNPEKFYHLMQLKSRKTIH